MSIAGTNLPGLDSEACSSKRDTTQSGYHNPYVKGVREGIRWVLCRADICTAFRTVITTLLVKTRSATEEHNIKEVIYRIHVRTVPKFTLVKWATNFTNEHKRHCRLMQPQKPSIDKHAINEEHCISLWLKWNTNDRFWLRNNPAHKKLPKL